MKEFSVYVALSMDMRDTSFDLEKFEHIVFSSCTNREDLAGSPTVRSRFHNIRFLKLLTNSNGSNFFQIDPNLLFEISLLTSSLLVGGGNTRFTLDLPDPVLKCFALGLHLTLCKQQKKPSDNRVYIPNYFSRPNLFSLELFYNVSFRGGELHLSPTNESPGVYLKELMGSSIFRIEG